MSPAKVRALRSVDIGLADADAGAAFFTKVWNLAPVAAKDGVHYLRGSGPFHHILSIRRTAAPCVIRMTFDAADRETVDALHAQVREHGLATIDPPAPLRQPHGAYGFGFKDPEGRNVAVVCGVDDHTDSADRPDQPRKLSHINLNAGASDATVTCLCEALGFTLTDTTKRLRFLSCNSDHHSVVVGFSGGPTLNHLAFEMTDLDATMRGAGRMRDAGHAIEWGPGRHGRGQQRVLLFPWAGGFPDRIHQRNAADRFELPRGEPRGLDMAAGPARSVGHQRAPERAHGSRRAQRAFHLRRLAAGWLALNECRETDLRSGEQMISAAPARIQMALNPRDTNGSDSRARNFARGATHGTRPRT